MDDDRRIYALFIGMATARISWYRCVLPALYNGCDWVGLGGEPPNLQFATGYVKGRGEQYDTTMPRYEDYDVVIIQQPRGRGWFRQIQGLQSRGIKVLYEADDYAHGIRKAKDHDFKGEFTREDLRSMELCMRAADGMICSTDYLARRYRAYNKRVWVCENGLDLGRYRLSRPERPLIDGVPAVTIMWSGATGHQRGIAPWLEMIDRVMTRHPHVRFASIGYPFAQHFQKKYGNRALAVPFAALETYPAAMTIGDIALAPAGDSSFYRAKSALRAMEAGALGIPIVADPTLYGKVVKDGETGFLVDTPAAAGSAVEALVQDSSLRLRLGDAARAHVTSTCDMRVRCFAWRKALAEAVGWI